MCLAVPAQLVEKRGEEAIADLHGNRVPISTLLTPEARVGDWVLLHAGFAIQQLAADEAQETWAILNDLQRHADADDFHASNVDADDET